MLKCQQLLAFNIYEQERFHALLSWAWKKFYNLRDWLHRDSCESKLLMQTWKVILDDWSVYTCHNTMFLRIHSCFILRCIDLCCCCSVQLKTPSNAPRPVLGKLFIWGTNRSGSNKLSNKTEILFHFTFHKMFCIFKQVLHVCHIFNLKFVFINSD